MTPHNGYSTSSKSLRNEIFQSFGKIERLLELELFKQFELHIFAVSIPEKILSTFLVFIKLFRKFNNFYQGGRDKATSSQCKLEPSNKSL